MAKLLGLAAGLALWLIPPTMKAAATDAAHYPLRQWGDKSGGEMNVSSFVFRDWNDNGIYDLGDRPMANVAVIMSSEVLSPVTHRSNISGFANFRMSATLQDREIVEAGRYGFRVAPPPGWAITSGNETQRIAIEPLPGSPGDMIASPMPDPVGLKPPLTIRGRVGPPFQLAAGATVTATGPDGATLSVALDSLGRFDIPVSRGIWLIEASGSDGQPRARRSVEIDRSPVVLPMLAPDLRDLPHPPPGGRITFDDLISAEAVQKIASGYGQVCWRNWVVTGNRYYGGEGYINGTVSGEYVAYNGSGHPAAIESDATFDFAGGYFSAGWTDAEGETLRIRGWRDDALIHDDELELSAMGPVYFAAGYRGLTKLEFSTKHYWQFVSDDLSLIVSAGQEAGAENSRCRPK